MKKIIYVLTALVSVLFFAGISSGSLNDGLIAHYPFNGSANDESGNGNDGIVYGATPTFDRFGTANSAYNFNGVNDYIWIGNSVRPSQISISVWSKTNSTKTGYDNAMYIIRDRAHGYGIILNDENINGDNSGIGKISTFLWVSGSNSYLFQTPQNNFNDDAWHHIVLTYDGLVFRLYIDGVMNYENSSLGPNNVYYQAGGLAIGRDGDHPSDYYQGAIDDIFIYNRSLSEAEVLELYNQQKKVGLIQLPQTGQTKCYDTAGTEIPCAGTGQDGELRAGVPWPDPRFGITYCDANGPCSDQSNDCDNNPSTDIVTDYLTGLVWSRDANLPNSYMTWYQALDYANNSTLCGSSDWRIPNANEIESIFNAGVPNMADWLNSQGFTNYNSMQFEQYWTSTTSYWNDGAWYFNLFNGFVYSNYGRNKSSALYLWLLRGVSVPSVQIPSTGQTISYYPGDDGDWQMGVPLPDPRFTENQDGTVTDNLTGLMWLQDANCIKSNYPEIDQGYYYYGNLYGFGDGNITWQQAFDFVSGMNNGIYPNCSAGYRDWRLPNIKELNSLFSINYFLWDFSYLNPPFINLQCEYWSSSSIARRTNSAWEFICWSYWGDWYSKQYYLALLPVRGGNTLLLGNSSVTGRVLYNDTGLIGVAVSLNGNYLSTTSQDGSYSFNNLADGFYVIRPSLSGYYFDPSYSYVDLSGNNITDQDFTAIADNTPPDTFITAGPAEGSYNSIYEAKVNWAGSDNSGRPLTYSFKIDNGAWSAFYTTAYYTFHNLAEGEHSVAVKAKDQAGNEDPAPAERHFIIDRTPPQSASNFTASATSTGIKLDWTPSPSPDIYSYRLYWDNGTGYVDFNAPLATIIHPSNFFTMSIIRDGTYQFALRTVDKAGNEESNTSVSSSPFIITSMNVTVNTASATFDRGQDVLITGTALTIDSKPVSNAPVNIDIESRGYHRYFTAFTNTSGEYHYTFQPLSNEAGLYTVRATVMYQGLEKSASTSFRVLGLLIQPTNITTNMSMNSTNTVNINLQNIGDVPLTGIQYILTDNIPGDLLSASIDIPNLPLSLNAGTSITIPVIVTAEAGNPPATPVIFTLKAIAAEGAEEMTGITVIPHEAVSLPEVSPVPFTAGVRNGEAITRTITVSNNGYAPMDATVLSVHDTVVYNWITVINGNLGTVSPHESNDVQIYINPSLNIQTGHYVVQLDLSYNGKIIPVYLTAEVTASTLGQAAFKVYDDTGSVVSGAEVNLISKEFYVNVTPQGRQEYNNVIKGTTDSEGYILITDVPAGNYRYVINAPTHDQKTGETVIDPGSTPQVIDVIMVTNLVKIDFSVTPTTIQDQYSVTLNITYTTDLIKPTLYVNPSSVNLSFFPEETQEGTITIKNTSNVTPVRNVEINTSNLDQLDKELEIRFADNSQSITIGDLAAGESRPIPFKARIPNASLAKLNNRNLGNIIVSGDFTFSLQGKAINSKTESPIPVLYWKPQDLSLPALSFINDETDGNPDDLEYQGTTYRVQIKSNRNMDFNNYGPLDAITYLYGGPDSAGIINSNESFWSKEFNRTSPLISKGDIATFDIDGLREALELEFKKDRETFLNKPHYIGFFGKWNDRPSSGAYLIPVSITTITDTGIIDRPPTPPCFCPPSPTWNIPTSVPLNEHGEVKLQIDQKVSLEREAFNAKLDLKPTGSGLNNVQLDLIIKDHNGDDASSLFFVVVTSQSGITSLDGGNVSGPAQVNWQIIPSSEAGGLQPDGLSYNVSANITYSFGANSYNVTTQSETITVKPMPKIDMDYYLPYVVMADKPAKIKVVVKNNGFGTAHNFVVSSPQPRIVENQNNIPISFVLNGSSPTPDQSGYQDGILTINFGDIPPGGEAQGYWLITSSKDGYFIEFTSSMKHEDYMGMQLDPLIEQVNTHFIPAIGGRIKQPECIADAFVVEVLQGGMLKGKDTINRSGAYFISDLTAGEYEWVVKDSHDHKLTKPSRYITVLSDQPTSTINALFPNAFVDYDNDGMDDCCEFEWFEDITHNPDDDEDNDGLTNKKECENGTDPLISDASSAIDPRIDSIKYPDINTNDIFWFVHISDIHIGKNLKEYNENSPWNGERINLQALGQLVYERINPEFIVASGDLTDSTNEETPGPDGIYLAWYDKSAWPRGPYAEEWSAYKYLLSNSSINLSKYYDIPGNHDRYNDPDWSYYKNYSIREPYEGATYTYRGIVKSRPVGQFSWEAKDSNYLFLTANTNDGSGETFVQYNTKHPGISDLPEFSVDEFSHLYKKLNDFRMQGNSKLAFAFGHHSIKTKIKGLPGLYDSRYGDRGAERLKTLINNKKVSAYLYGHTHENAEFYDIDNSALQLNTGSLAEDGSYRIVAVDNGGISTVVSKILDWPVVLITSPIDKALGCKGLSNCSNTYRRNVPKENLNPVRALVFHNAGDSTEVFFHFKNKNDSNWSTSVKMQEIVEPSHAAYGKLWETNWDTTELLPGDYEIEVYVEGATAQSSKQMITVQVVPTLAITGPMELAPNNTYYFVGTTVTAKFTITNKGTVPATLDKLLVGGRINGGKLSDGVYPDFTSQAITLAPGQSYQYEGSITLNEAGNYRFFCAYYINNPLNLTDEKNWNVNVDLAEGLGQAARVRNLIVLDDQTLPVALSELRDKVIRELSRPNTYPPYLMDPNSFTSAVATVWIDFTSWATQSQLTEKYDELYQTGISYDFMRIKALKNALDALNKTEIENAKKYLDKSFSYLKASEMSFSSAIEFYDNSLSAGEILANGIREGCQASVQLGLAVTNPAAAKYADYFYLGADYVVDRALVGKDEAMKNLAVKAAVSALFSGINFDELGGKTIADYTNNKVGKLTFPMLQKMFQNNEQIQFILSKIIKESVSNIESQVAEELVQLLIDEMKKGLTITDHEVKSPVELLVYDSQGRATGLFKGIVRQEIPRSIYDHEKVTIYFQDDNYIDKITGIGEGTYGLTVNRTENGVTSTFNAISIPILPNVIHDYAFDWISLSNGQEGVTVEIDANADSVIEKTFTSDNELTQEEFKAALSDFDGDGIPDAQDGCPNDPNKTTQGICGCSIQDTDSDNDGIADCNDNCPNDTNNDIDGDGVCGDRDNCPLISNPGQPDADSDGKGDVCDPIINLSARTKSGKAELTWSPVIGAKGYNTYRSLTKSGPYTLMMANHQTTYCVYLDDKVTNGTTYYYVVRWINSGGQESINSNETSAIPTALRLR